MTRTDINRIIRETNTNKEIKWSITSATKNRIVLTNDYIGKPDAFVITWEVMDVGDEFVKVEDTSLGKMVGGFIYNPEWANRYNTLNDFESRAEGFKKAIQCAVKHFNYCY